MSELTAGGDSRAPEGWYFNRRFGMFATGLLLKVCGLIGSF